METIKKVVVIGPESTGKSTLCAQLAAHFKTSWVPEYAREYLEKYGTDYSYEDLLSIAKGQIELEEEGIRCQPSSSALLFIDTDMYVTKVWCE
ncbi:MAG: AAA family ATPase, partial [Ginsengibacter sp.]